MSILTNGFHPTFESLSALADQGELDGSRTRVGRHVAHCARCRAVVEEIRSYGEAVRDTEMPGAPDGLWARINAGLDTGTTMSEEKSAPANPPRETPSPEHDTWRAAPALRPTTHVPSPMRRGMRRGGIVLAAAAVAVAVLLVPTSQGDRLQASPSMGTWRFSPATPAPGATVSVRFEPPAGMMTQPSLMLLGILTPEARAVGAPRPMYWSGLQDSLGMLTRQPDGAYTGRFAVPGGFKAMLVRLADVRSGEPRRIIMSPDGPVNRDREPLAMLVSGNARGEPSLASLTVALELWSGQPVEPYSVADTLMRYFPSEPIGYAADRRMGPRRLIDDLIAYFKRGERQYLKFDERYMAQPAVSMEREMAMIIFAHRIDEPGEVRKWTLRLVREHGDDPRALYFYSSMLMQMLSRPNTVDSVRAAMPLADSLWERNGHRMDNSDMIMVALTVKDTSAQHRWSLRAFTGGVRDYAGGYIGFDAAQLREADVRAAAMPVLHARASTPCALPPGKFSLWTSPNGWRFYCELQRAAAFNSLSYAARFDGRPREALALADSAMAVNDAAEGCAGAAAHRRRGEALLAMHDTAAALPELARGIGYRNWQAEKRNDSLAVLFRARVNRAQWDSLVERGTAELAACSARRDARWRAARSGK